MPRPPLAHIAGVGLSNIPDTTLHDLAISAGTKALLDAGVTYSDVDHSIGCFVDPQHRIPRSCFDTFGMHGTPVSEIDNHSGLFAASQYVQSGQSNCLLAIGIDTKTSVEPVVVAIVLVSTLFLTSHAYLKDQAVSIRACALVNRMHSRKFNATDDVRTTKTAVDKALRVAGLHPRDFQLVEMTGAAASHVRRALVGLDASVASDSCPSNEVSAGSSGWERLCRLVYQLRGWTKGESVVQSQNCLQCISTNEGDVSVMVLSRSDGKAAPTWDEVKNVRDGRERLGYNPAVEEQAIAIEDFRAVRARKEFTSDDVVSRLRLRVKGGDRAALARL